MTVAIMRVTRPRLVVGVMVHECHEEIVGLKSALMGAWQRVQLQLLLRLSHARGASITRFVERLQASWPHLPVERIPASSPFSNARGERGGERARRRWGIQNS